MIGRLHHVIVDCPEPRALAAFYSELLGLPVTHDSGDFVVLSGDDRTSGVAFQRAPDHKPPRWPDPAYPQQLHLDVMADDVEVAAAQAVGLGATMLARDAGGFAVLADPAGHPFCLVPRPGWAPPVHP